MLEQFPPVRPAIIAGWYYAPYELVGDEQARERLKQQLTFKSRYAEATDDPINLYFDWSERSYFGVPRAWGRTRWPDYPILNKTCLGADINPPKRPDPNHPRVKDPIAQAQFMRDLHNGLLTLEDVLANAPTGSGKTTCSLDASANLGRRTLTLVHLSRLQSQWIEEVHSKLGVPYDRIGRVVGDRCEWRGKDYVIGMLPSVAQRQYERDFYRAFGTVIFDEVHKMGTEHFAPAIFKFPARYRLAMSATTERDDGGDVVYKAHCGPVRVRSEAEYLPMNVLPQLYRSRRPLWGKTSTARVSCLIRDMDRNWWLAGLIKALYDDGRQPIIVSASIVHLQLLMKLATERGVPASVMGQFTGMRKGDRYCPIKPVYPQTPEGKPDKTQPVIRFQPEINEAGRVVAKNVEWKIPSAELDRVMREAQLTFATYGMLTEGIDNPRWDAGLDVTPVGKATQLTGRIRRPMPNKRTPLWLTPVDLNCKFSERWFQRRCRDYASTDAEIMNYA